LSLLRVFKDLRVFVQNFVAEDVGVISASPGAVPCLYAAAFPAYFPSGNPASGENRSAAAGSQSPAPQKER
jgi:hypothetical protein